MRNIITKFEIPDTRGHFADEERGLDPSAGLIPFSPPPLDPGKVLGRVVREICTYIGTYGMGGPGFFGLRLDNEWLVISIWGAAEWLLVDDRLVMDSYGEKYKRPAPWMATDADTLALDQRIVGSAIVAMNIQKRTLDVRFSSGAIMVIDESPSRRPIREGSQEPRILLPDEDLRQAIFLSPTTEIWV